MSLGAHLNHHARIKSNDEAARLDLALRGIWSRHPKYVFIANEKSFFAKLQQGITALTQLAGSMDFPLTPPG